MMRRSTFLTVGAIFLGTSAVLYLLEYLIFGDIHFLTITLFSALAYLPLEVFIVVIVIERVLATREKQNVIQKLNMVLGGFFSEMGTDLVSKIHDYFGKDEDAHRRFLINLQWNHADFNRARASAHSLKMEIAPANTDLEILREFLKQKRSFLLSLLQNPNLLEHEQFTDLLWATTHVAEELEVRNLVALPSESDIQHIVFDIERMYGHLISQWLFYAEHLKEKYPYLYSLTVRTNPFLNPPIASK
jgi:hypothetical protein